MRKRLIFLLLAGVVGVLAVSAYLAYDRLFSSQPFVADGLEVLYKLDESCVEFSPDGEYLVTWRSVRACMVEKLNPRERMGQAAWR